MDVSQGALTDVLQGVLMNQRFDKCHNGYPVRCPTGYLAKLPNEYLEKCHNVCLARRPNGDPARCPNVYLARCTCIAQCPNECHVM